VLGLANILPVGKLQGEELWQGLDAIGQNARNHAPLVEDLLDMSRIMSGKGRLEIQLIDVSAILKESIETLPAMAEAKGVRLQAVMHPYAVPISGSACSKR
jgi:signal transduction histidine kinase